jgi:hypothetical protein
MWTGARPALVPYPTITKMNPIARRRFRSCCWSARSTPMSAEAVPARSTVQPHEVGSGPPAGARRSNPKRNTP